MDEIIFSCNFLAEYLQRFIEFDKNFARKIILTISLFVFLI